MLRLRALDLCNAFNEDIGQLLEQKKNLLEDILRQNGIYSQNSSKFQLDFDELLSQLADSKSKQADLAKYLACACEERARISEELEGEKLNADMTDLVVAQYRDEILEHR